MIDCKTASISEIQVALADWQKAQFSQYFDGTVDHSTFVRHLNWGVAEEYGEFCHARLKLAQGIRGDESKHVAALRDAIADMLVYLMQIATAKEVIVRKLCGNQINTRKDYGPFIIWPDAETAARIEAVVLLAGDIGFDAEECLRATVPIVLARDWKNHKIDGVSE